MDPSFSFPLLPSSTGVVLRGVGLKHSTVGDLSHAAFFSFFFLIDGFYKFLFDGN
jgi:hypothetical protein